MCKRLQYILSGISVQTETLRIVAVAFGQNVEANARIIAEGGAIAAFGSARDVTPALSFRPLTFRSVAIGFLPVCPLAPGQRAIRQEP